MGAVPKICTLVGISPFYFFYMSCNEFLRLLPPGLYSPIL
jgi:hypothetical protein